MSNKSIADKLSRIQAGFPVVGKDRQAAMGAGGNYKYRGVDDAMGALNPLLTKHRVTMMVEWNKPEVTSVQTASGKGAFMAIATGQAIFLCGDSGEAFTVNMSGVGMDSSDKCEMKAKANALKYTIYQCFTVPTSEVKDSEAFEG